MRRDQKKDANRERILAAAEQMIRERGNTDFSMGDIAASAGLAVASLYNLVGTKPAILFTLLNNSIDRIIELSMHVPHIEDVCQRLIEVSQASVDVFTADPQLIKPLYRFFFSVEDPVHRPEFMDHIVEFWLLHLTPLKAQGMLPETMRLNILARDFQFFFSGTLGQWLQGDLDDQQFSAIVRHGTILRMLAIPALAASTDLWTQLSDVANVLDSDS